MNTTNATTPCPLDVDNEYCQTQEDYVNDMWLFVLDWRWWHYAFTVVYACIFIVGVCGNVLVVWSVMAHSHMRTVTNYYIGMSIKT